MAFTVTDLQEVLHLLGEQPQLRAQFRTLLVTDSLQVLPEQVARLSTAVEQLAEAQGRTEQRLERLAEAQQRTEEQVRALAQAQQRTEERLEQLAQAQQRTEARLERLEATVQSLAEAQQRTEVRLEQLAEAQQRTEARLEQLAEAQQRTEARLEQLAEAQQRTEARLEQLAVDVRALTVDVRNLTAEVRRLTDWQRGEAGRREGERYERTLVQQAIVWFNGGQGDPPVRPAIRQHLNQILQNLDNLGALTEEQNPLLADLIWWKDEHYAVVEISRHVNGHDITRAAQRAATLEAAGVRAIGIVIGQHWGTADTRDQAIDEAVQWRVGDDLSAGYLAFCRRPA